MNSILVKHIYPNPQQPRRYFDPIKLSELAASIHENGLQVPVLVEDVGDGFYVLVSGERRWRAHQLLGLETIQAIVRPPTNHSGKQRLVDATVENVQRESMTPVEEGHAFRRMRDEHGMKITEIARVVGVAYPTVTQRLKLTELEPEIQDLIATRQLPSSIEAVEALFSVQAGEPRIKLAKALASHSATIKMIASACKKFNQGVTSPVIEKTKAPALVIAEKKVRKNLPEWDALYQVGKVPPWPVFNDQLMKTCDACGLRPVASDATCRDCPLVDFVRRMLQ